MSAGSLKKTLHNLSHDPFLSRSNPVGTGPQYDPGLGKELLGTQVSSRPKRTILMNLILGAYLPTLIFIVLTFLFTFTYHLVPPAPWFALILAVDLVVLGSWPPSDLGCKRTRWDWFPLTCGLLATTAGLILGLWNYHHIEPWIHAKYMHEYTDVRPDANPRSYSDAGLIHFAEGAHLDVGSFAAFRQSPHVYCAAPIVDSNTPANETASEVGFWAVGLDCCLDNKWDCDNREVARSGLRVESHPLGVSAGHGSGSSSYNRAVAMAGAKFNMPVAKDPVFVVWHKDPAKIGTAAWWSAAVIFGFFVLVAFCCCGACQMSIQYAGALQKAAD